jgi:myosin heavy subunit
VFRKLCSKRRAAILRHNRRIAAALLIDRRLRGFAVRRQFLRIRSRVTLIQSVVRRWKAGRSYEKKRNAAIRIATSWRGYNLHLSFKEAVRGMIVMLVA